jgi:RNA polymerase sigma-70 factor (ECF subfamily)
MNIDVEDLFRRYGPLVIRRCRQLLKDEDEALEVSQDVFVQLLRRRGNLKVRNPASLLYRIATNLSLNRIRDRKRRPTTNDDELLYQLASVEEPNAHLEARSTLGYLFGKHPASSRVIAILHYVDGLTLEEVAKHVGMSVPGVRKRLRALRHTLAEMEAP